MIGKIVDKGTIKSLDNALHLKKYNHLLFFRQKDVSKQIFDRNDG